MLHRHVNVMEYVENNIAVLVTVYGINQGRRHYKKKSNEHNYISLVVRKLLITKTRPCNIQQYFMAIKTDISD